MRTMASQEIRKGLAGIAVRMRAGKATGWGVFHPGSGAMASGGMMLIIAAFLPWVYVSMTQAIIGEAFVLRGTDGPGVVTLWVGFLAFAGAFVHRRKLAIAHAAIPGALVALIVVLQAWKSIAASVATAGGSFLPGMGVVRSEERRVGKECRARWGPEHEEKRKEGSEEKRERASREKRGKEAR